MIRRLRCRAGLYMSIGLLLAGWTLAARANEVVTNSKMQAFVYLTLAIVLPPLVLGSAGLLAWILHRDRYLQGLAWAARAEAFEEQIKALIEDCQNHRCAMGPRNPADSPHRRRATDNENFDAVAADVRGKR